VLTADSSTATGVKWATPSGGELKWLGNNYYTSTTQITPSTVSPNAKMVLITVIGGGGSSGGVAATTSGQVAVAQNGATSFGIQVMFWNDLYFTTNCTNFANNWELVVGAGGYGTGVGNTTGSGGFESYVGYPVSGKPYEWYIRSAGGDPGNGSAAATPPLYVNPSSTGSGPTNSGTAPNVALELRRGTHNRQYGPATSYATSTTFSHYVVPAGSLDALNRDYIDTSQSLGFTANGYSGIYTTPNSTATLNYSNYGGGAAGKIRLGTNATAVTPTSGGPGIIIMTWFG
jgi:hypothetical protein